MSVGKRRRSVERVERVDQKVECPENEFIARVAIVLGNQSLKSEVQLLLLDWDGSSTHIQVLMLLAAPDRRSLHCSHFRVYLPIAFYP